MAADTLYNIAFVAPVLIVCLFSGLSGVTSSTSKTFAVQLQHLTQSYFKWKEFIEKMGPGSGLWLFWGVAKAPRSQEQ